MRLKRVFSVFLCAVLLSGTLGSSLFHGYEVKASAGVEVIGGSALFEFLLGLFGVSVAVGDNTPSAMPLYNEYLEYLRTSSTQLSYDEYEALSSGNVVTISSGLLGSVKDFLDQKVGSLTSGNVQEISGGYFYSKPGTLTAVDQSFIDFISSTEKSYFLILGHDLTSSFYSVSGLSSSNSIFVLCRVDTFSPYKYGLYSFSYDSYGLLTSYEPVGLFTRYIHDAGWKVDPRFKPVPSTFISPSDFFYTNCPVAGTFYSLSSATSKTFSELISSAEFTSLNNSVSSGLSVGGYSQKTISSLQDKVISKSVIDKANSAVVDAITSNTIKDIETGAVSYTDVIAQAVADAVAKALADAGLVDKPGTGEGEGEGEEEKPLPVVPELLDFLKGIKDSVVQGFENVGEWIMDIPQSIGGFFTDLWEWLQKIWEAICALPGQIADAFEKFFLGSDSGEGAEDPGPPDGTPFLADLSKLFPFCIPFDLIRLFKVLQSTAKAPYWEVPLDVPSVGLHYVFVIDFVQFEMLAKIFRTCETVGFCFGLILVTRKLIRG